MPVPKITDINNNDGRNGLKNIISSDYCDNDINDDNGENLLYPLTDRKTKQSIILHIFPKRGC